MSTMRRVVNERRGWECLPELVLFRFLLVDSLLGVLAVNWDIGICVVDGVL